MLLTISWLMRQGSALVGMQHLWARLSGPQFWLSKPMRPVGKPHVEQRSPSKRLGYGCWVPFSAIDRSQFQKVSIRDFRLVFADGWLCALKPFTGIQYHPA